MHVLLVTQDFPPDVGGTQTYAMEVSRGLARHGHQVTVVCPARRHQEGVDTALNAMGIRVHRVASSPNTFPFRAVSVLRRICAEGEVDVSLAVAWPSALSLGLSRSRVPLALAVHGRELLLEPVSFPGGRFLYDRVRRMAVRSADVYLPVSRYTATLLKRFGVEDEHVHVVNNGTDPDTFFSVQDTERAALRTDLGVGDRPMVLSVCRLVGRKGVDTVIKALPRILEKIPRAVYVVAGEGPDSVALKRQAEELGLRDHVVFTGRMPYATLRTAYSAADVFVLPARQADPDVEGFGIVFLEANACETPVVGARTGGIPDAIVDGETGLLVEADSPDELAGALIRLLSDKNAADRMGRQGRQRILDTFNWSAVASRIATHLNDILPHSQGVQPGRVNTS